MMRFVLAVTLCGMFALTGCAALPVNYAAADAMTYSRLTSDARSRDPQLSKAIKNLSASEEHQRIQQVIANLPEDMQGCLIAEAADYDPATGKIDRPAITAVFQTGSAVGYVGNMQVDAGGEVGRVGGGWRAAVWDATAEETESLLPEDPSSMLPVSDRTPTAADKSGRTVVVITLVKNGRILSVAGWSGGDTGSGRGRLIRFIPSKVRARLNPSGSTPT